MSDPSQSESDFELGEMSEDEILELPRVLFHESMEDLMKKLNPQDDRGMLMLYLASSGVITKEDLELLTLDFIHSRVQYDPVSIDQESFVTQSLADETQPDTSVEPFAPSFSYRFPLPKTKYAKSTGSTLKDDFTCNHYAHVWSMDTSGAPKGVLIDRPVGQPYICGSCEVLHDYDVPITCQYRALTDISIGHIHPGLLSALDTVYAFQSEEIYKLLSKYQEAIPIVKQTMLDYLVGTSEDRYLSNVSSFIGFCYENSRSFPHAEHLLQCLSFLHSLLPAEGKPLTEYINNLLVHPIMAFLESGKWSSKKISVNDSAIITRFATFYRQFLRKFHPLDFFKANPSYVDASIDWKIVAEVYILSALSESGVIEYENQDDRMSTPKLDESVSKALDMLKFEPLSSQPMFELSLKLLAGNRVDVILTQIQNP